MLTEDSWEDLLTSIEDGKVIPVVGEGAVTFAPHDNPLYPWLAQRLAERLGVPADRYPAEPRMSDVVAAHLAGGGLRNAVYTRLFRILRDEAPAPGSTLVDLAGIAGFRLYLTTAIDSLLEQALRNVRAEDVRSIAFHPGSAADLPLRTSEQRRPCIFHLLGRATSAAGEFVAWEEDLLDFICELQRHIGTDVLQRLACDLKTHSLLVFGLRFSDWALRFLLRVARQESLSRVQWSSYLAEGPPGALPRSLVLFLGGVNANIHVIDCDPAQFAADLARRWRARPRRVDVDRGPAPRPSTARGAIFVSYAREDEAAVLRIKAGLEEYGCVVWYDRERLQGAQDFEEVLHEVVHRGCSIFISVVSRTTESAIGDQYFRRERTWAAERAKGYSESQRPEF